ncbi:MAG: hypothetical protein HZA14_11505 [Nitrospirae bacterium]|nr:hypothetical protein [Nitrospirota bacterium]
MSELTKEIKGAELLTAIKASIGDARFVAQQLSGSFKDNVRSLRLEENEDTFLHLEQNINDLRHFMEFVKELGNGLGCLNELSLPPNPASSQNSALNIFKDMNSAFETKDWIMLSDLIEYELAPLLDKEDEWLGSLDEKLQTEG